VAAYLPIEHWHDNIQYPTMADAVLDRWVHDEYKINLKGESMRKL
jgi:DNA replication protein DnaC